MNIRMNATLGPTFIRLRDDTLRVEAVAQHLVLIRHEGQLVVAAGVVGVKEQEHEG
jgi:hypothetical protein